MILGDRTRLVGRDAELAALSQEIERSAAGEFRCVLVSGDPGVGKTRVAEELLTRSAATATTLASRAGPLGGAASFGLWAEALEQHLRELPIEDVTSLCGGVLDDLAGLLRTVAVVRAAIPDREAPRIRLLESLATLLANLARHSPVVLLLDDVHQADASSWDVLTTSPATSPASPSPSWPPPGPASWPTSRWRCGCSSTWSSRRSSAASSSGRSPRWPCGSWLRTSSGPVSARTSSTGSPSVRGRIPSSPGGSCGPCTRRAACRGRDCGCCPRTSAKGVRARVGLLDQDEQRLLELLTVADGRVELDELVRFSGRELDELVPVLRRLTHRTRLVLEDQRGNAVT